MMQQSQLIKQLSLLAGSLCLLILMAVPAQAQILDYENRVGITLDDGTQVILYGRAKTLNAGFSGDYFYLPVGLRLSRKADGKTPEFLYTSFTTEKRVEDGGTQGALLHFLMEWGLTDKQLKEAQKKLEARIKDLATSRGSKFSRVNNPRILGPAEVRPDGDNSFRIISGTLQSKDNLITSGMAPVLPGVKAAVAAKLDKYDAQLLASTFEKSRSISDVDVQLFFTYNLLYPAIDGRITVNWTKIATEYEKFRAEGRMVPDAPKGDDKDEYIEDSVMHTFYTRLVERKAINIVLDDKLGNEQTAKITELFFNVFSNSIANLSHDNSAPVNSSEMMATDELMERYQNAEKWKISVTKLKSHYQRKTEVYNLKYRLNVPYKMYILGNLAEWYDQARDNPACVTSINLNNPFFEHRDINMILDIEAEEIFGKEANFVTVNVRKRRSAGNDFSDQVTIDREYLKEKGLKATVTYARGEDSNSDVYEYKTQWSLKGGHVYPENPNWIKGDWEGVTLAPPISPRLIEFEADLDELKEMGIRRATLQVRYMKFGKETETNIPITVSRGNPLVEKLIFTDRDTRGYVYRLVLTHQTEGKLALDWDAKINDDYVFATIPPELRDVNSELFKKAIDIGKTIISGSSNEDKTVTANEILDQFRDVINIVSGN